MQTIFAVSQQPGKLFCRLVQPLAVATNAASDQVIGAVMSTLLPWYHVIKRPAVGLNVVKRNAAPDAAPVVTLIDPRAFLRTDPLAAMWVARARALVVFRFHRISHFLALARNAVSARRLHNVQWSG